MSLNLNVPQLSGGMANPETTVNDATAAIDAAVTETLVVDLTNSVSLSAAQYRSAFRFSITPTGASKTLTLPAVKRMVYIGNDGTLTFAVVKGSTSINLAAASGGFFYTDGTTNGLIQLSASSSGGGSSSTNPFDIGVYIPGLPLASAIVFRYNVLRAFTWPINLTGSVFNARVAATATAAFLIKQNGSTIGTLSFAAAATVPTVTFSAAVTFAVNDVITITAPGSVDATLADIAFDFFGSIAQSNTLVPFDMGTFISGKPLAAAVVLRFNVVRQFVWKASLTGSVCNAGTASAASAVFTIKNNGSSIGTVTFSTSATGTISFTTDVFFAVNDVLTIEAPAVQDTTLADVALNIFGAR
jgi:hypothetical protein